MSNVHRRGFASMSPEKRKEIARLGGKKSAENWQKNKANFANNRERARAAGRKGGAAKKK